MFLTHPASAAAVELTVAPYDPAWRFELPIAAAEPAAFDYATGTAASCRSNASAGRDPRGRHARRLAPRRTAAGSSCRCATRWPARRHLRRRRYLIDTIKGADLGRRRRPDTIVLDFNFAYNPSCAYDPAWACPLGQPGNRCRVEVPVGEPTRGIVH